MSISHFKLSHNNVKKTLTLGEGTNVEEFSAILKTLFSVHERILGVIDESGEVILLSLVCRNPSVAETPCTLLIEQAKKEEINNQGKYLNPCSSTLHTHLIVL